jgi:hypothetical protein
MEKNLRQALETFFELLNFLLVAIRGGRDAVRVPRIETGAGGVRSLLVPILLLGGLGYEV